MQPPPSQVHPQGQTGLDARITGMVDGWKRRLLDLTRRNRALDFRPTRVSTVSVVGALPGEVFRRLYLRGLAVKFRAAEKTAAAVGAPPPVAGGEFAPDAIMASGGEFAPYAGPALNGQPPDEWLQTASAPEVLDHSLRRIDELARTSLEEQGVNTLFLTLGMLGYRETPEEREVLKAPLVMLPVTLARKSARTGYVLRAADDEPLANPALAELLRRNYGLDLPELPASDLLEDSYDLQSYFTEITRRFAGQLRPGAAGQPPWALTDEIFLAPFSFQKLVMYRDLETNAAAAAAHRLVRQLATREGSELIGLPPDVRALGLDQDFAPENTFQVVDADASQLRAIAAVTRQHDLVIQGPPGTGKSQTITNLIATALAAGKSVLFVAEKQAALSVVHSRLVAAGLGEFCLELHATKANKRAVLQQIGEAIDASLHAADAATPAGERLPAVRAELSDYVRAVHAPFSALHLAPFRVYGEYARVLDAPRLPYEGPVDTVTPGQFDDAVHTLRTLAAAAREIGPPAEHPWRDATKVLYLPTELEEIAASGPALAGEVNLLQEAALSVAERYGLPRLGRFAEIARAGELADLLARSPGVPLPVLTGQAWDQPPAAARALVERVRTVARLRAQLADWFTDAALDDDHADDIAFVEARLASAGSLLALANARYRAIRGRWRALRRAGPRQPMPGLAADLRQVGRWRREREALRKEEADGRALFGARWRGGLSDADELDRALAWVVEFHGYGRRHDLVLARAAAVAAQPSPHVAPLRALVAAAAQARAGLRRFTAAVGWPGDYLEAAPFPVISSRVDAVARATGRAPRWAAFAAAQLDAARSLAGGLVPAAREGRVPFDDLERGFLRAFYAHWLAVCLRARPALATFSAPAHEGRLADFRALDERVLQENRARLVGQLRERVQARLKAPDAAAGMPWLRRELARQRGHQPLRRTLHEAEAAIRAIKPCFMMSPLTVAQFLDGRAPSFDLVIFDEASQLPSEDAMGAVIRGRQLVVVGDPKQLPPTTFFASSLPAEGFADDGTPLGPDAESVLEEFMGAGMPVSRLRWHYRSTHESLINFSNVSFYDAELCTFPSVETGTEDGGLQFEFVEGGTYEGKGVNPVEARRVADAVVVFARQQLDQRARGGPALSLGVGTFNLRQQLAITDELESRRREDPRLEPFFDRAGPEPFFVKNLENIQGDERDVVFISVTYARAGDGKLRYNFGPLNTESGWRRLNVLVTRARGRMRVFAAMRGDEIAAAAASPGARLLREFLLFAERGRLSVDPAAAAGADSPLARDVAAELTARGWTVRPQVGAGGYRLDLGVLDDAVPGRFLCAVECDGPGYQAAETARDRDRLRPQVLATRGWTIFRIWSAGWFLDRRGQIERLVGQLEQARRTRTDQPVRK